MSEKPGEAKGPGVLTLDLDLNIGINTSVRFGSAVYSC